MRYRDQNGQIPGTGLVFARQTGRVHVAGVKHAEQCGLCIHVSNKRLLAAWEGASQGVRCTVLAGHQRQVQGLATCELGSHAQTR